MLFPTSFFPFFPCKHDISTFPTTGVEERYLPRAHKRISAGGSRMPNISNHRVAFVEAIRGYKFVSCVAQLYCKEESHSLSIRDEYDC